MKQSAKIFLLAVIVCLFGYRLPGFAEDVRVSTTFDKRAAAVNEEIHMAIRVEGSQGNIQAPKLPSLRNFDTFYTGRASHMSFINGQSSSRVEFNYVLVPKEAGQYTLPPIEIMAGGQLFRTDPIQIQVDASRLNAAGVPTGGVPPATYTPFNPPVGQNPLGQAGTGAGAPPLAGLPQEPPLSYQPADDNIFVRATLDKTRAYPNEQVLLSYSLFTRYDTRYEGFEEEPQTSGFWIEEFPQDREVVRETVRMNGKRYVKADIKKVALFPTTPAEYTIHPGSMKVSIRQEPENTSIFDEFFSDSFFSGGGFFTRRENRLLKPPVLNLTVKPLPKTGQPESFQGAVGNFRMNAALDKQSVKQNEPVTMKLVIEGEGNIETLNKPKIPESKDFKIYDSDTSSQLFKTGDVIGGRKTFEIVFIPMKAGNVQIPVLEFSYFNPKIEQYVTLKTPAFPLDVTVSEQPFQLPTALKQQDLFKKDIEVESKDIRYIKERLPDETWNRVFHGLLAGLLILDFLLTIPVLWGLFRGRQERLFAKDLGLRRRRTARSQAESRIRKLRPLMKGTDPNSIHAFFEETEKILTQYLSDKLNLPTHGVTREDLERRLEEILGPQDSLTQELKELYQLCDESRFAKAKIPYDLKDKALKILRETLSRIEKARR